MGGCRWARIQSVQSTRGQEEMEKGTLILLFTLVLGIRGEAEIVVPSLRICG